MVVAKNDHSHRHLSEQFADHGRTGDLERAYLALVWGMTERPQGYIDAHLGRSHRDRTKQAVVNEEREDARHAITHYSTIEKFAPQEDATALASLVECRLETGRTHQIRVHMAHIGHPLVGDMDYGSAYKTKANKLPEPLKNAVQGFHRQALHAFCWHSPIRQRKKSCVLKRMYPKIWSSFWKISASTLYNTDKSSSFTLHETTCKIAFSGRKHGILKGCSPFGAAL